MHKSLLVVTLLIAAAAATFSQTTPKTAAPKDNSEQAVLQAIQTWLDADERHDRATLDSLIADDFVGTAPRGRMVTKRDVIPEEGSGGHRPFVTGPGIKGHILLFTALA